MMARAPAPLVLDFEASAEDTPGPDWKARFDALWPGYRAWYLRASGAGGHPGFLDCRKAMRDHMPEIVPLWETLVELAGGGDVEARFLSGWSPPAYIVGCSQLVWRDPTGNSPPRLLRNYDYAPELFEGHWQASRWSGRRVVAMADCLWGALDGMNEAGLAVSLAFSGRSAHGPGFGIPLVLRYLLETCETVGEAVQALQRLPVSMSYSVMILGATGAHAMVMVGPDHEAIVTRDNATTNHRNPADWPQYATATATVERLACLEAAAATATDAAMIEAAMLTPPVWQTRHRVGHGTLYTARYVPALGAAALIWPGVEWDQTIAAFTPGTRQIVL